MNDPRLDFVIFTVATGLDTLTPINTVRIPMYEAVAHHLRGRGKVLVVTHYANMIPNPFEGLAGMARRILNSRLIQKAENLFVYTPLLPAPLAGFSRFPLAFQRMRDYLGGRVRAAMRRIGMQNEVRVVTVNDPFYHHLLGVVGESLAIYDCLDDFGRYGGGEDPDPVVLERERQMTKKVNLVFTTSRLLYEKMCALHSNVHYFPNAVDFDFFHRAMDPSCPVAPALRGMPRPVIGFMGSLQQWYDFRLLRAVIQARPNWSFVFIGWTYPRPEVRHDIESIRSIPNVHFLGWQRFEDLPSFLKGFDAAIMPYQLSAVAKAVNPDKMYQYMAAGVPIVSTPIPEAVQFAEVIEIARDSEVFIRALERCVFGDNRERVLRQIAIAREETWDKRVGRQLDIINEALVQTLQCG